jgi:hypothetical protein
MITTFVDHAKKVISLIEKEESNCDISDLFYRYTLDSIGCIGKSTIIQFILYICYFVFFY